MLSRKAALLLGTLALAAWTESAQAIPVTVSTGLTSGTGFQTLPTANPFTGSVATANFQYMGAINFSNAAAQNSGPSGDLNSTFFGANAAYITGYTGSGTVSGIANFSTLSSFLASSGSASGYQYASLYSFDLGVLAAGTVLTITHDDGVSVFQGSTQIGPTVAGPTTVTTDTVTIHTTGDTVLWYSRQNGTPSILQVSVPEPISVAMFGVAMAGLGMVRSRRKRTH